MQQKRELVKKLKSYFETHVFMRGKMYFENGAVGLIKITKLPSGSINIKGDVRGRYMYKTEVMFNPQRDEFEYFECDCPYDVNCKHATALGLAFIEEYVEEDREHIRDAEVVDTNALVPSLAVSAASINANQMTVEEIEQAIKQLEEMKRRAQQESLFSVPKRTLKPVVVTDIVENPFASYYLLLSKWNGHITLRHNDNPYQLASVNNVRIDTRTFTDDEKELLKLLKLSHGTVSNSQAIDLGRLLMLAYTFNIKIYDEYSHYSGGNKNSYKLETAPKELPVTLSFNQNFLDSYGRERPRFIFTFDSDDVSENDTYIAGSNHLIRIKKNVIELYPMSGVLASCIASILYHRSANISGPTTLPLRDCDTIVINEIIESAYKSLDFTCACSTTYTIERYDQSKKVLVIDFSHDAETLSINACIDYGFTLVDVVEGVVVNSNNGKKSFRHRSDNTYNSPLDTHVIAFDNDVIRYAPIDTSKELELFSSLYDKGILPNMKPRVTIKRLVKIYNFYATYWQLLEKHCKTIGCDIRFTNDTFSFSEGGFRADFNIDINTDNDWLAFDTTIYLGKDKVTLADIERILEGGSTFFKDGEGRLMHITNHEELEKFVAMLKRFSERAGRFEAKLYNAPELKYTVTNSPYYNAERSKGFDAFCKSAEDGRPVKRITFSKKQQELLRPYQKRGVEWLYFLRSYHFAGILADDMGLGKTLQTLVLLERERITGIPSLVICPKTLLYNWQSEATKFTPKLKVAVVDGTPAERAELIKQAHKYDLLITGYATYKIDSSVYEKQKITFNYCVLDEAQFIKNHTTKNARIIKEVDAKWRLALSGTPLENSVSEIWSVFDFLMPNFLGSYKDFSQQFHTPIMKYGDTEKLAYLRKKVECFMLRRTKEEVLPELPPKIIQESHCQLNDAQNLLYQEVLARVKQDVWQAVKQKGFEKSGIHILAGLTKLRQVCNHPNLLLKEKNYRKYSSAKLDMFNELVEEISESKRKILVFSQFTGMLDILSKELDAKEIPHVYLSGKTRNRQQMVDTFNNNPAITVFLISLKAGGTGLNLTSADTVIIFDPWWNPSVENQAIDRAHRIGQKSSVNVYKLITKGTIEEKILALQQKKKNLFDALIGESKDIFKKLTWDDVQELFR